MAKPFPTLALICCIQPVLNILGYLASGAILCHCKAAILRAREKSAETLKSIVVLAIGHTDAIISMILACS